MSWPRDTQNSFSVQIPLDASSSCEFSGVVGRLFNGPVGDGLECEVKRGESGIGSETVQEEGYVGAVVGFVEVVC